MALLARLLWEAVLLIGVVVVIALTAVDEAGRHLLTDGGLGIAGRLCIVGLLATGLSLSVRVGAPNLAVGSLAAVGAATYGNLTASAELPVALALLVVLAGALAVGLLIAVGVAALRLPAWAVSLGVALVLSIVGGAATPPTARAVDGPEIGVWTLLLTLLLALGSVVVGALMWTHRGPQVASLARRAADPGPAGGWNVPGALLLVGVMVVSSVLAAGGGILAALSYRSTGAVGSLGADYLVWALVPVFLAGTSLRSPRGVVAGIVLASALEIYAQVMFGVHDAPTWVSSVLIAVLALVGLLVGRGLDAVAERMTGPAPGTGPLETIPDAAGAG